MSNSTLFAISIGSLKVAEITTNLSSFPIVLSVPLTVYDNVAEGGVLSIVT